MSQDAIFFTFFFSYFCYADGQPACSTPDDHNGTCISVEKCPSVVNLFTKPDKTHADIEFLEKSRCGDLENISQVCCPTNSTNSCLTPEGYPGTCISIFSCPHLASLVKPPVSEENIQYVRSSRCSGPERYSVCCSREKQHNEQVTWNRFPRNCAATSSAFPAHPSTRCCGEVPSDRNYLPGTTTRIDDYPWLALIQYNQGGKPKLLCGGTLISGRYVLTAAHCVTGDILKLGSPENVHLGEFNISQDGLDCVIVDGGGKDCTEGVTSIPIELTIPHPRYNNNMKNTPHDIALIRIQRIAPYTDFIRPICLPSTDVTVAKKTTNLRELYVAGWGAISDTETPPSQVKLHVGLPYMEKNKCQTLYNANETSFQLTSGQICAGGVFGKDFCKGDSGGPLMYEQRDYWEIIGVHSFGLAPCGTPDFPAVYTKVYDYIDWIKNVIVA